MFPFSAFEAPIYDLNGSLMCEIGVCKVATCSQRGRPQQTLHIALKHFAQAPSLCQRPDNLDLRMTLPCVAADGPLFLLQFLTGLCEATAAVYRAKAAAASAFSYTSMKLQEWMPVIPAMQCNPVMVRHDSQCAICLDELGASAHEVLPCGHAFHAVCVRPWLSHRESCPICRQQCQRGRTSFR